MDETTHNPGVKLLKGDQIITIPQGTNKYFLPLFYALPKEFVSKAKEYLDFPRCPYDPIWTTKYDEQINNDVFMLLIMDCYAWTFWQFTHIYIIYCHHCLQNEELLSVPNFFTDDHGGSCFPIHSRISKVQSNQFLSELFS